MILSRVSPVSHSIGNCVKRVVVIVASIVAFQNPVSAQNAAGAGLGSGWCPGEQIVGCGGAEARARSVVACLTLYPQLPNPHPSPPGTCLALFGVFLYSQAKRKFKSTSERRAEGSSGG